MSAVAQAAISLGTNGAGPFGFATNPVVSEWSTRIWSGNATDIVSVVALDTAVQTNNVSLITNALDATTGAPPAAATNAQWASDGQFLITRPTQDAYAGLLATVVNGSGGSVSLLSLAYDLTVVSAATEQVAGHLVYYSRTGLPNSWVQIPGLSGDATTGGKFTTLDLSASPLAQGATIYFLWVDDNGSGSPDTALEIDNVAFALPSPPIFTDVSSLTNRSVLQCRSFALSASVLGSPPLTLQWFRNDSAILGATNATYTIASMTAGDAGDYFLGASNSYGMAYSPTGHVTYVADTVPPAVIRAVANPNLTNITVTFSESFNTNLLAQIRVNSSLAYADGASVALVNAQAPNDTTLLLTSAARDPLRPIILTISGVQDSCLGNVLPNVIVPVFAMETTLLPLNAIWKYEDLNYEIGTDWYADPSFDDVNWRYGLGPFDAKLDGNGANCRNTTLYGLGSVGTCISPGLANPTVYFRTHFTFPGDPSNTLLRFSGKFDDGAIIYLNGSELARVGLPPAPVPIPQNSFGGALTPPGRTVIDTDPPDVFEVYAPPTLKYGDNLLAVELKQVNGSSSDLTMGLQIAIVKALPVGGDVDLSFAPGAGIDSGVYSVALQPDGKVIIGGYFFTVHGAGRTNIARLNADGSLDTGFHNHLGFDASFLIVFVRGVALQPDGKVLIAGDFSAVNDVGRNNIARLQADGSPDTSFLNGLSGANKSINAVALQPDGKVLIGGYFTTINGQPRSRIARLNADGTVDNGFLNGLSGADDYVSAVAFQPDGKVLLGGAFTTVNGQPRNHIARLNVDGTLDSGFLNGLSGASDVYTVTLQPDEKVLLGGYFTTVNGQPRNGIARLHADGTLDSAFLDGLAGAGNGVNAVALQSDGKVLLGGRFSTVNGQPRNGIARLHADGTLDSGFLNGLSGADYGVNAVALQPDGRVLIGGSFFTVNGVPATNVARLWGAGFAPALDVQPQNQTVFFPSNVTFSVLASAALPFGYQWFFNGAAIANATNATLSLSNVVASQSGNYTVVLSNPFGSVTSSVATLTVHTQPLLAAVSSHAAPSGSTITLAGYNFSPAADSNIVWFGAVRAQVVSATSTQLVVTVPAGATYAPVSVTVAGFTAYSAKSFTPTFPSNLAIDANTFAAPFNLSAGSFPVGIAVADLDGDGRPDLAIGNNAGFNVSIYRNTNNGGTLSPASFALLTNLPTGDLASVVLADIDGDGKPDLVISEITNGPALGIFRNISTPGAIAFASRVDVPAYGAGPSLAFADFDGDGRTDMAVANNGTGVNVVSIFRFIGPAGSITTGSFAPRFDLMMADRPVGIAVADFNNDGRPDLAVTSTTAHKVAFRYNTSSPGALSFGTLGTNDTLSGEQNIIAAGDFDGDGLPDLAWGNEQAGDISYARNGFQLFEFSGFDTPIDVVFAGTFGVAVGDLNGDGKLDLVAGNSAGTVALLRNQATNGVLDGNSFAPKVTLETGSSIQRVAVADLNGDGRPEILVSRPGSNVISIFQNNIPPPPITITTQPGSRAAAPGSTVAFAVTAITYAATNYQWRFNGADIAGATNRTLMLTNVQGMNFGTYAVVVSDGTYATTSSNAVLTLAVRPLVRPPTLNGTNFTMVFPTESGPAYVIEYKARLEDPEWTPYSTLNGTGANAIIAGSTSVGTNRFFRIRLQ